MQLRQQRRAELEKPILEVALGQIENSIRASALDRERVLLSVVTGREWVPPKMQGGGAEGGKAHEENSDGHEGEAVYLLHRA